MKLPKWSASAKAGAGRPIAGSVNQAAADAPAGAQQAAVPAQEDIGCIGRSWHDISGASGRCGVTCIAASA
ncbi:MAG: hypothetical protein M0Q87_14200 [Ottowia sp.]|nr:hypothetical protein [Ottowia sp.]